MCSLRFLLTFIFILFANVANSTPLRQYTPLRHHPGGKEHVVLFTSAKSLRPRPSHVLARIGLHPNHSDVLHTFSNDAFSGFAANIHPHCAAALKLMPDVHHVSPSVQVSVHGASPYTRTGTTWGLQRISSSFPVSGPASTLAYTYTYNASAPGAGVDIYVVDTGIYTANAAFTGRARMAYPSPAATDLDGHGTHVSGTAGAALFGVASAANLVGVKVLGANGTGSVSAVVAGVDYVLRAHAARRREVGFVGSVMSMSLAVPQATTAINAALAAAAGTGFLHIAVAAGNYGADACGTSPASAGGVNSKSILTVGAIGIADEVASFSNTGRCVDVYAPGEDVCSTWIGGPGMMQWMSGTSMATPHVSGVMAYLMSDWYLASNPAAMKEEVVRRMALGGVLESGRVLLNNGITG